MSRKMLFLDRDGTLIVEPADHQIDSLDKFRLVDGVIPALLSLRDAGFRFVMVSNQDGLGGRRYPLARFKAVQEFLIRLFESQGLVFAETLLCPHRDRDRCACRKPQLGLVAGYLADPSWDRGRSAVVGDRDTDMALARNMGIAGFKLGRWQDVARKLLRQPRAAKVRRATKETTVTVEVDLDGSGRARARTGIGFFDHMLEQIAKHGGFDLSVAVTGDLEVDEHHTVEDTGLALGAALRQALGDKVGIGRYGFFLPMDEASAQVSLDLSGRPYFTFKGRLKREAVGGLPTELVAHFFRSLSESLGAALHIELRGENAHHMVESAFKAVGRSLRQAIARTGETSLPTTKGAL